MSDNAEREKRETGILETIRHKVLFILVKPLYGGNVGSTARTLTNMGFNRLVLVDPCDYRSEEARMMAAGNNDVLLGAQVHDTLDEALSTVSLAIAASRRSGRNRHISDTPDTAASLAAKQLKTGEVAFVFGNEVSGLSADEFDRCQLAAHIPTSPISPSMNLSHSVTVFAYELRKLLMSDKFYRMKEVERSLLPRHEMEIMYNYWEDLVQGLDLEKCTSVKLTMRRIRTIFDRTGLDMQELAMMRKIIKWAAGRVRNGNG